ncbi:MAG: PVC-type heme-binding CxxCH protein [Aureliella sp.]
MSPFGFESWRLLAALCLVALAIIDRTSAQTLPQNISRTQDRAGNAQVAEVMKTFVPRGVQADDSEPTPPQESLDSFKLKPGVAIDLVAAEPTISQPLHLSWDSRGRMWVVQYRQYQFPAGLKIVRYDHHLRAVFDKTPEPPPHGTPGADRITVFEDTNGDGIYDQSKDVLTGLNIATSTAIGRGGIWVLNPPHLLFYPDADRDDVPDRNPEVHLWGFGLQDTHAVANSLQWGPDGWLYGANGSTTTCNVSSKVTSNVAFEGQCIWRYHPKSHRFEIWAEGGGNTFSLDIDSNGQVFCGNNGGNTRGWHMPQGSYSRKNWGKHGPLTNPYAFGFFGPMQLKGDTRRFAQAFVVYEGGLFPKDDFHQTIIAPNAMQNLVWHSRRVPNGSSYQTEDTPNLLSCSDRWFRPVYSGVGPDGAIYIADWYDTRLSHVSPTDDWHKTSGRVYRLRPDETKPKFSFGDLHALGDSQLLDLIFHPNRWIRRRVSLELGWRQTSTEETRATNSRLIENIRTQSSQESLCALAIRGGLSDDLATEFLRHASPHIRRWTVRLLGDEHRDLDVVVNLASGELDPHVRIQLAASARRFKSPTALGILAGLLRSESDKTPSVSEPHEPLMLWWALEEHADDWPAVRAFIGNKDLWETPTFRDRLAANLMQRYASQGSPGLKKCTQLLTTGGIENQSILMVGLERALQGRGRSMRLPPPLETAWNQHQRDTGQSEILIGLSAESPDSIRDAIGALNNSGESEGLRGRLIDTLSSMRVASAERAILSIATGGNGATPSLQRNAIRALTRFGTDQIGSTLVAKFDNSISGEHELRDTACRTLAARPKWTLDLLNEVNSWRLPASEIPPDVIQRIRSYKDPNIVAAAERAFGKAGRVTSTEAKEQILELKAQLSRAGQGDAERGEKLFIERCGTCHRLFGTGNPLGPDLDNYDRKNLDFWLPAIVAPSLEIREGYQSYAALMDDDRIETGMISAQNPRSITLRTADNRALELPREEISELRALETSLMPKDLLKDLDAREVNDLMSFLSQ